MVRPVKLQTTPSGTYYNLGIGVVNNISIIGTAGPEIQVLDGAADVPNTGIFNFGSTTLGTPITKTFTIKNTGNASLTLGVLSALPSGFSLVGTFPTASITAGGSAAFQVQMDAATVGTPTGILSFVNGDVDENPYSFDISGTVTNIVTGIEAPEISNNVAVFPNPVTEKVNVVSDNVIHTVKIVDITGKQIYNQQISKKKLEINATEFENGIYFIYITNDKGITVQKIIVEK